MSNYPQQIIASFLTETPAFDGDFGWTEAARVLRQAADIIEDGKDYGRLHDSDGVNIGYVKLTSEEPR